MGDPDVDHGFVFDDQGRTDVLASPFFDVHFGNDESTDDYVDRILYQLTLTIEAQIPPDGSFDANYFQQTEESNKFRQEFEMRKMKQDQGLDTIAEGLDTLKNMAHDMNEELDRQVPLIDEIDTKVDRANADLKNTNVRLKDTINQLRSSRNFCIDIILLCIILGIAAYLYNVLKK
ncbi:hypothetical protein M5K25_026098 [Dendrobium thyrsiflorum]|uniref:t-SNARE coiled-coil homology domain-containing protein n=1 Tax=Dendrobium thyrsiflorum TaxID=117978 RepID=A0ABD0TWV4_DENTH